MAYPRKKRYSKKKSGKKYTKKSARVVPGFTRKSGFYGANALDVKPHEIKFFDTNTIIASGTMSDVAVVLDSVNLLIQGTGESGRIGRKVNVKNIEMRMVIETGQDQLASCLYRWIVFLDKQCNGTAAQGTDILTYNAVGGSAIVSPYNLQNVDRFVILADQHWKVEPPVIRIGTTAAATTTTTSVIPTISYKSFFKRCNIPLFFDNTGGGAIASVRSNNIGWLFIQEGATQNTTTGRCISRIRFSDS